MAVIFAYIYATTRVFFAMSRDGLLPESLRKLTRRQKHQHFQLG
ncbi:Amino acid permease [Bacillus pseudomycoides]|nr:Amino acid permease [Bacillus pseudomycoides]